jgi:hypothetical protein
MPPKKTTTDRTPQKRRLMITPDPQLYAIIGAEEGATTVNLALAQYATLIERATAEVSVTYHREDWNYVAACLREHHEVSRPLFTYVHPSQSRPNVPLYPASFLCVELREGETLRKIGAKHYAKRPAESVNELVRKTEFLTPTHVRAIMISIRHYWLNQGTIDPKTDEWWTVDFRRTAKRDA